MQYLDVNYKGIPLRIIFADKMEASKAEITIWWKNETLREATLLIGVEGLTAELIPVVLSATLHELGHLELAMLRRHRELRRTLISTSEGKFREETEAWAFAWRLMRQLGLLTPESMLFSVLALLTCKGIKFFKLLGEFLKRYGINISGDETG